MNQKLKVFFTVIVVSNLIMMLAGCGSSDSEVAAPPPVAKSAEKPAANFSTGPALDTSKMRAQPMSPSAAKRVFPHPGGSGRSAATEPRKFD